MFELKSLILIILMVVLMYEIYKMYSFNTILVENTRNVIIETVKEHCEDIMDELQNIEEIVETKLNDCNSKITEILNIQNKLNEISKMNNQTILNQINQYEEANYEHGGEHDKNNFNSFINSDNSNFKDNKCFIKLDQQIINERDLYMSSDAKNSTLVNNLQEYKVHNIKYEDSSTSSLKNNSEKKIISKVINNNKENSSSNKNRKENSSSNKNKKENSSSNKNKKENSSSTSKESFLLEISNNGIKTNINTGSPKGGDINKILNDSSKIIKNNSFNDLKRLNENLETSSKNDSDINNYCEKNTPASEDSQTFNDPPLVVINDYYKTIYNNNKSKIIEIK